MVAEDSILPATAVQKKASSRPVVRLLGWMVRHKKDTHYSVINFFKDGKLYAALCNPIDYRIDGHLRSKKRLQILVDSISDTFEIFYLTPILKMEIGMLQWKI